MKAEKIQKVLYCKAGAPEGVAQLQKRRGEVKKTRETRGDGEAIRFSESLKGREGSNRG